MKNSSLDPAEIVSKIPYELLKELIAQKATGKLMIQSPFDEFVTWQIYLGNGRINFANSRGGAGERLSYLLGSYLEQRNIQRPQNLIDDYSYICKLWEEETFSFQQVRSILTQFSQEALVQILSLPKATCSFDYNSGLKHLFLNLDLNTVIKTIKPKISYWWKLHSEISSPFQRPLIDDWEAVRLNLNKKYKPSHQWLETFSAGLKNLSCLYEIAGRTKTSTLELALMLRPYVKNKEITMLSYQDIQVDNRPLVVYIDDKPARQRMVGFTLTSGGFKVTPVQEPLKALAIVMSQKPSLVLMDMDIAAINGYQLCGLLRKYDPLQKTPIVLLSDRLMLVDRIQSKLAGASGIFSKPFLPHELIKMIEGHINCSQPVTPKQELTL